MKYSGNGGWFVIYLGSIRKKNHLKQTQGMNQRPQIQHENILKATMKKAFQW